VGDYNFFFCRNPKPKPVMLRRTFCRKILNAHAVFRAEFFFDTAAGDVEPPLVRAI
jgi:hypothetical protein